jgi:hypothetical protein
MTQFLKLGSRILMIGIVIGIGIFAYSNKPKVWEFVGSVPETPTEVFYVYPHIYVKTSDNLMYSCEEDSETCTPTEAEIVLNALDNSYRSYRSSTPDLPTSLPRGPIATSWAERMQYAEGYSERFIVVLEDGTIWTQSGGGNGLEGLLPYVLCGLVIAIALALGFFVFLISFLISYLSHRYSREKAKNDFKRS